MRVCVDQLYYAISVRRCFHHLWFHYLTTKANVLTKEKQRNVIRWRKKIWNSKVLSPEQTPKKKKRNAHTSNIFWIVSNSAKWYLKYRAYFVEQNAYDSKPNDSNRISSTGCNTEKQFNQMTTVQKMHIHCMVYAVTEKQSDAKAALMWYTLIESIKCASLFYILYNLELLLQGTRHIARQNARHHMVYIWSRSKKKNSKTISNKK